MAQPICRVLVTGADGFIGKNLVVRLRELPAFEVFTFVRSDSIEALQARVAQVDAVIHLAGENRPLDEAAFAQVNTGLTMALCDAIRQQAGQGHSVLLVLASSTQAERDNPYGRSKLAAEYSVQQLAEATGNPCVIFRLPGVFGKWCKPNYNSVVATYCHNMARELPIQINDAKAMLRLVYIDDVVSALLAEFENPVPGCRFARVEPEYGITLGELAVQLQAFKACKTTLLSERVGAGLVRALYATYVSYLPNEAFAYPLQAHVDPRGTFVEMLKTPDAGQFSYFTAHPGVTRGGHYHHSKTEKFLVIKGMALFRFRHLLTQELVELRTNGTEPQVVDTIPGWTHDITNIGTDELIVMLWANENFDRERPDTYARPINAAS